MSRLSQVFAHIFQLVLPAIETVLEPLTDRQRKLAAILETIQMNKFFPGPWYLFGRPRKSRVALAHSFVAKMVYNLATTRDLIELLNSTPNLRRLCGWDKVGDIPSESTFSRAFAEFANTELPQKVHAALIEEYEKEKLVGHISRDATDIVSREKAIKKKSKKELAKEKPKKKRGRPKKGEERPGPEPTRIQRQRTMGLEEMVKELSQDCDFGFKSKDGQLYRWKGYKLHFDWADGEIPISMLLTSASVHDSQAAIPLATMSAQRVTSLYDLMDAAYDAKEIREFSLSLGHIPIIDKNQRRGEPVEIEPASKRRYDERSTAERGNSFFKESFGGGHEVRFRGAQKAMAHLMWGVVALTADRLLNLLV